MSMNPMETVTVQELRENLPDLIQLVARGKIRVEVTAVNGERCVLISKQELDGLEKAIAILSDTDEFRDISTSLTRLAESTSQAAMA